MSAAEPAAAPVPRGWRRLAALGPLRGKWQGQKCTAEHGCDRLAIVLTPDGARCEEHPPLPARYATGAKPAGWGHALDWTPRGGNLADWHAITGQAAINHEPVPKRRACLDVVGRCYCGRCDNWTPPAAAGSAVTTAVRRHSGGRSAGSSGDALRRAGVDAARSTRPAWSAQAAAALRGLAEKGAPFTADDLVNIVGLPGPSEANRNNAVGAAFNAAAEAGLIRRTGDTTTSKRPEAHSRRIAVWCGLQS